MKNLLKKVIPSRIIDYGNELVLKAIRKKEKSSLSLSQVGQDYWVYGEVFNEKNNGFFVDIGAHDGVTLSNTYILEKRYGWRGICVDANPNTFVELIKNRSCICHNRCVSNTSDQVTFALDGVMGGIVAEDCDNAYQVDSEIITIDAIRLEDLLEQEDTPSVIDYLTIDIEGAEDRALLNFPFEQYRFNCITIERPSPQLRNVLEENGYLLVKEIPKLDCFYIHSSFIENYSDNQFAFWKKRFLARRWR